MFSGECNLNVLYLQRKESLTNTHSLSLSRDLSLLFPSPDVNVLQTVNLIGILEPFIKLKYRKILLFKGVLVCPGDWQKSQNLFLFSSHKDNTSCK